MFRNVTFALALMVFAVMLGGCKNNKMSEQVTLLTEENENLRDQLDDRNEALESANYELRDKEMALAQLRRDLDSAQAMPAPVIVQAPTEQTTAFDNIPGVTGYVDAGEITAVVESDILFNSGKSTLKNGAKQSLNAVASALNSSYAGQPVRIGGYTDTDPIKKSGFKSNYHLGFERAYVVRDYLASRGVAADRMYIASYGPDRPAGSKAQSRRVEITAIVN